MGYCGLPLVLEQKFELIKSRPWVHILAEDRHHQCCKPTTLPHLADVVSQCCKPTTLPHLADVVSQCCKSTTLPHLADAEDRADGYCSCWNRGLNWQRLGQGSKSLEAKPEYKKAGWVSGTSWAQNLRMMSIAVCFDTFQDVIAQWYCSHWCQKRHYK